MECKLDHFCPESSHCENSEVEKVVSDLWIDFSTVTTGLLAVICFLLYRLSQALIKWSIRSLFSLTGLTFLWNLLSHIVYLARGLFTVLRWSTHVWSFFAVMLSMISKISWIRDVFRNAAGSYTCLKHYCEYMTRLPQYMRVFSNTTASSAEHSSITTILKPHFRDPGLRLILLGPSRGLCGSLRDSLLRISAGALAPDEESTVWREKVDGEELTVIETPDLLGASLGAKQKAQEALKSLQLASPGPHAFVLVLPTTYPDEVDQINIPDLIFNILNLFDKEAADYVLVVFTCVNALDASSTLDQLFKEDHLEVQAALTVCDKRIELVKITPGCSVESRMAEGRRLLDRIVHMRSQQGHYIHKFLQREDQVRMELLNSMTGQLAQKLEKIGK